MPELCDADADSDSDSDDDDDSVASIDDDSIIPPSHFTAISATEPEPETPLVIDNGSSLHCGTRIRKPNPRYA
jgi:hypothetical protein